MNPLVAAKTSRNFAAGSLLRTLAILAAALLCTGGAAFAATASSVTLAWDANPETNIASYELRYGTASGAYTAAINADTSLSARVTGLNPGTTYYFAVVAKNSSGQTSPYSSEVVYTVPGFPNTAPLATLGSVRATEDTPVNLTLEGTDVDGDSLTFSTFSAPVKGDLSGTPPNLIYTPRPNQTGTDSFTFRAFDGILHSEAQTFSVVIDPVNDAPLAAAKSVTTAEDTNVSITLPGSDVDGDTLIYSIVSGPAMGTLSGSGAMVTYQPNANAWGTDSFTYKVSDGLLQSTTATMSITVTSVNDTPVATGRTATTVEDTPVAIVLAGTDVEGGALSYAIVGSPANGTLSGSPPNVTYTPKANYNGADSFTFRVNDGAANSANATVNITITAVNDAPVAAAKTLSTNRDTSLPVTLSGTDVDGNPLTYTVMTNPTNGTVGGIPPNLTYYPKAGYTGSDSITYKVSDGLLESAVATVSINVVQVNNAPVATARTATTAEDTAVAITLAGTDAEGSTLSFATVTSPANGTLSGTPPNLTYTPKANFNGADSFTFRVNDGVQNSANATVSITVTPVNDAPVATPRTLSTNRDVSLPITLSGTDVDGNPLTYVVVTNPTNGTVGGTPPNLTYYPKAGYTGSDRFSFWVSDGKVNSAPANVDITVKSTNRTPLAHSKTVTTMVSKAVVVALDGSDADANPLSYRIVGSPASGTLTGTPPNVTYKPKASWTGSDRFTYVVNDGSVDSSVATVTVNVKKKNTKPVATPFSVVANQNSQASGTLTGSDADGDSLSFAVVKQPANGTLSGTPPNVIYTPKIGYKGKDRFTYAVSDGIAKSTAAIVDISVVNPNNKAPIAQAKTFNTTFKAAVAVPLQATDADSDPLTYRLVNRPVVGKLTGKLPNLVYKPKKGFIGSVVFTFVANDGSVDSAPVTVTINVSSPIQTLATSGVGGGSVPVLVLQTDPAGGLLLQVTGTPGNSYGLEHSENLTDWSDSGTVTVGESGITSMSLTIPSGSKSGFYRLKTP